MELSAAELEIHPIVADIRELMDEPDSDGYVLRPSDASANPYVADAKLWEAWATGHSVTG